MKPAASIAALFLSLVALFHLLRIIFQVPVTAGSVGIPMWASVLGVLGPGALAVWLWREQKRQPAEPLAALHHHHSEDVSSQRDQVLACSGVRRN